MPKPVLTDHVKFRMEQRGITERDIYTALAREIRHSPGQPGTVWVHGRVDGGETLKVCIRVNGAKMVVVTAAWPD